MKFRCPECGDLVSVLKFESDVVRVYVEDYGNGPELFEDDLSRYRSTRYECKECGYLLPCIKEESLIRFILKYQEKSK